MTSSSDSVSLAAEGFRSVFSSSPSIVALAPGRINLIGEHTDYNDGFVLPAAINVSVKVAGKRRPDDTLVVHAALFKAEAHTSLKKLSPVRENTWMNYIAGVAAMLQQRGVHVPGADLYVEGDVPLGAGLSSSAALEVAAAHALLTLAEATLPAEDIALLCQKAEHTFPGVKCGIMDQFISALGKKNHALFVDCRSLAYDLVPIPPGVRFVVCNTNVKRELASSEYNRRRADCATGAAVIAKRVPAVKALRDVTSAQLSEFHATLDPVVFRRCRHVVTEDERVLASIDALRRNDLSEFGKLMYQSHFSLKNDYEVSCQELDAIVDICAEEEGVFGARMTGAGFGGCAICMVQSKYASCVADRLAAEYPQRTGLQPTVYVCSIEDGVRVHRV